MSANFDCLKTSLALLSTLDQILTSETCLTPKSLFGCGCWHTGYKHDKMQRQETLWSPLRWKTMSNTINRVRHGARPWNKALLNHQMQRTCTLLFWIRSRKHRFIPQLRELDFRNLFERLKRAASEARSETQRCLNLPKRDWTGLSVWYSRRVAESWWMWMHTSWQTLGVAGKWNQGNVFVPTVQSYIPSKLRVKKPTSYSKQKAL